MQRQQEKECFERVKKLAKDKNDTRLLSFLYKATANSESSLFPDFLFVSLLSRSKSLTAILCLEPFLFSFAADT